ncbi:MAG: hypothetical protein ACD_75C01625G0002 [uncultured bacterium]|nr:MAG: hypothetical protein ACD_75C01625G0002 [uncultured bacterium]
MPDYLLPPDSKKLPVARLAYTKLAGEEDVAVALIEKTGHVGSSFGGEPFNAFPGLQVESLDRTFGGQGADLRHQIPGIFNHLFGFVLDGIAEKGNLPGGKKGNGDKREDFYDNKDGYELLANPVSDKAARFPAKTIAVALSFIGLFRFCHGMLLLRNFSSLHPQSYDTTNYQAKNSL